MFVNARHVPGLVACRPLAWSHSDVEDDDRFQVLSQADFIRERMSDHARQELLAEGDSVDAVVGDWQARTAIAERVFFDGPIEDMAGLTAKKCLLKADVSPARVDAIIGGTNTGPGYPSLADHIKLQLGDEASSAMAFDVAEACSVGGISIMLGWNFIRSGFCQRVLVVCAEKATTLTVPDNWKESNLFGDAAFAVLLSASEDESFLFFEADSLPFGGNIRHIYKKGLDGFSQNGRRVHRFVGSTVVRRLIGSVKQAGILPQDIDHWIPHQPSGKTLDFLWHKVTGQAIGDFQENPDAAWHAFRGIYHRNVETTGNTSGAATGWVMSKAIDDGVIKPGHVIVVSTFGAGLSVANYGLVHSP